MEFQGAINMHTELICILSLSSRFPSYVGEAVDKNEPTDAVIPNAEAKKAGKKVTANDDGEEA